MIKDKICCRYECYDRPIEDFNSSDLKLFVAIIEYATYNNTGSNGETEFLHVMKK